MEHKNYVLAFGLTDTQRDILLDLFSEWRSGVCVGVAHDDTLERATRFLLTGIDLPFIFEE
jgi:hypothetical protein